MKKEALMKKRFGHILLALAAGFIASLLIQTSALADESGTITGNGVNLRSGPAAGYSSLGKLYKGDAVTVTGTMGGWTAVTSGSLKGYVYSAYVVVSGAETGESSGSAGTEGAGTNAGSSSSVLQRGSGGAAVKQLQGNLIYMGYLNDAADGSFGAKTETAVKLYQRRNGLTVDGKAGAATNAAIQKEVLRMVNTIETAKKYLGTDYVSGGASPAAGFDCSGLTQYAFLKAGMTIPRVSADQAKAGISVPAGQLRPGDLVAFNSPVTHVGIYIGGGKFIHSPKTGDVIKVTELKYMNLTAVRRFTGVLASK